MDPQNFLLGSIDGKLGELQKDIAEIKDHLKTLNGKTGKNGTAITRLNLVVFGICGPVALAAVGAVLSYFL